MLEKLFHITEKGANPRTELLAGLTTFMTMAYILMVNAGMFAELPGVSYYALHCHSPFRGHRHHSHRTSGQPAPGAGLCHGVPTPSLSTRCVSLWAELCQCPCADSFGRDRLCHSDRDRPAQKDL